MAARSKDASPLDWNEVDTENLSKPVASLFKVYRTAQDAANEARVKFDIGLEKALRAGGHIPEDLHCVIGHKWGRVSYAASETEGRSRGSKKAKVSV